MNRVLTPVGVALLLVGVMAAAIFVLLPLPTLNAFGGQTGWCGPGRQSTNALQVRLNPDVVNQGSGGTAADQQAFKDFCVGEADNRLMEAGLALLTGLVLGGAAVIASTQQRKGER